MCRLIYWHENLYWSSQMRWYGYWGFWGIIREYFIELCYIWSWLFYYDHWITYWMTLTSFVLLCIYHLISPQFTLFRDHNTHCIHYLIMRFLIPTLDHVHWVTHYLALALINEINEAGNTEETGSRGSGRCAWKGGSSADLATRDLVFCDLCAHLLLQLHDTWVQWTVSLYSQDPLTHHLFNMQLSCGMGHMMVALV